MKAPFMIVCVERPEISTEINAAKTEEFRKQLVENPNVREWESMGGRAKGFGALFTAVGCKIDSYLAMQLLRTAYRYGQRIVFYVDELERGHIFETDLKGLDHGGLCVGNWARTSPADAAKAGAHFQDLKGNFYIVK